MTLCVVTKGHCLCQPDEGVFCPDYKPDAYVQYLMDAITELKHDLERSMANHNADLNAPPPEAVSTNAQDAAVAFRESLVARADEMRHGTYPLWHGWALYEAFVAGAKWQESRRPQRGQE